MKKPHLLIIVFFITITCQAQDAVKKNTLSISVGAGYLARQDLIFSPFIHTDITMSNLGLAYTREANLFQKIQVSYASFDPMVSSPYKFTEYGESQTADPHSFTFIDFDYLIGKNIKQTEKSTLTGGGVLTSNVQAMNYVYGRFSNFGYYSTIGLGIFARNKFTINNRNHLVASVQLPLLIWFARSPYLVNDDEFIENISSHAGFKTFTSFIGDGQLVTWNKLQTFDAEVKYTYSLNTKWALGAAYGFEFIHASRPRPILSFRNALNLSANFKF